MVSENNYILEQFDPEVLREYDIRGIVDHNLTNNTAYSIGRTFGHVVYSQSKFKSVVVGYDGRLTSPKLHDALCQGLMESGIHVTSIGMVPTPMTYFAHYHLKTDAAIMITGSHNPPEYNGFKMVLHHHSFYADKIQELQSFINSQELFNKKGSLNSIDIIKKYVDRNLQNISLSKKLRVAWDTGNGAMGLVIEKFTKFLNKAEHFIINQEVDGTFPNHHPDPTVPKNMKQLINIVLKHQCDIGFAFDGDGDRLGVVDNKGTIIWADQYMIILAKEIASLYNRPKIIMDVKSSQIFFDEVKRIGCEPIMFRTGHSPIKEKMREVNSPLSGEMSGHVCFADDFYGYDDAMYVALRLLRIISRQKESLNNIIAKFPITVSTPETRFDVKESRKFKIVQEIKERLSSFEGEIIDIDGIRVQNNKGWFGIRASNTQNQLTCRAEAYNKKDLYELIDLIEEQLKLSNIDFKFTRE